MRAKNLSFRKSQLLFREAQKYLPGGVSSNSRLWRNICPSYLPCSIFIKKAKGSHIWDVDNNKYIDYRLGFGPVILGHSYKKVHDAVHKADENGLVYALDNELEIKVAKQICNLVKRKLMVRYANSGTESTMSAIRLARGYTKKNIIVKFQGHYHGAHDAVLFSANITSAKTPNAPDSLGVPPDLKKYTMVCPWNNFDAIEKLIKKYHKEIAAVITEPVMANAAVIPPVPGYLQHLRELCTKYHVLLIFDEVKTGFRLAPGGAQQLFHVNADIITYAKSLANGYPISAIVGIPEVMKYFAPGKVLQGGTYSSNPVSLSAAYATLNEVKKEEVFDYLAKYGRKLINSLKEEASDANVQMIIQGYPTMFQMLFTDKPSITSYTELASCNYELFAKLHYELLRRGVMLDEDNEEPIFTCYSHSSTDLNHTTEAFRYSLKILKKN